MAKYDEDAVVEAVSRMQPSIAGIHAEIAAVSKRVAALETPPPPATGLTPSGPVVATANGQVIEGLHITAPTGNAVTCQGYSNVIIRNCKIDHGGGHGIFAQRADGLLIETVDLTCTGAPTVGVNPSQMRGISIEASNGAVVQHCRFKDPSSAIYVGICTNTEIRMIKGENMRGPLPRGQLVQFNHCDGPSLLEDFHLFNNPETCWNEDGINISRSTDVTIRRGLIDGSNAPSGTGVTFEHHSGHRNALVEDVDCINMSNSAFGPYPGHGVVFRRCNARDNHCGSRQDRGLPSSGGLIWAVHPSSTGIEVYDCKYFNPCGKLIWHKDTPKPFGVTEEDFTPREPIELSFPWEG